MEAIAYIFIGICVIGAVAWWISVFGALAVATKKDADEGNVTWVHGAFWAFIGTCLLIGMLRGCQ